MKRIYRKSFMRERRRVRGRKRVCGTKERPRLSVHRTLAQMYCQVIDDTTGTTLASSSTLARDVRDAVKEMNKSQAAKFLGQQIAKVALRKGITCVVFDRGGFPYHGRIKSFAEGAREGGLKF